MRAAVFESKTLLTLGALVSRLRSEGIEVSTHQLKYAIEQGAVEPIARVGILRVWGEGNLPEIRRALAQVRKRRIRTA